MTRPAGAWVFTIAHADRRRRCAGHTRGCVAWSPDVAGAHRRQGELFHRVREFFGTYDVLLLPVSQVAPFPVGLQVVGPHRADRLVLEVGRAFEARTRYAEVRPTP